MKDSLLWKVSGEKIKPSFILGTMHVKSESVFRRIEEVKDKIKKSDVFMAEYHLDNVRFVQNAEDLLIPEVGSLSNLMGKRQFEKIQNIISKSFKFELAQFEYYLPLLIVNIISESILSKEYHLPLDMYLWNFAKDLEKEMKGAESYESQLKIMSEIKIKDQVKMLKAIAKNPKNFRKKILRMADWYSDEKIYLLYKYGRRSLGKYKDVLLYRRNYKIVNSFLESSKIKATFLAVGVGHLSGNKGLLRLLKQSGYTVKAI